MKKTLKHICGNKEKRDGEGKYNKNKRELYREKYEKDKNLNNIINVKKK